MEEDLREHYENEFDGEAKLGNTDAQDKRKFFFDSLTSEVSLQEHLIDQLKLTEVTSEVRNAAEYLIGSLDENGFLNSNLSDISLISLMPLADLQEALATLQTFEPIGIASIDLQDCLLRQMDARGWEETDQYTIVKDYFSLLVRRRVPELSRKLSQPTEIINEAIEKISDLDPSPGKRFSEDNNQSISADATVEKVGDEWTVLMRCDGAILQGPMVIRFTPPDFANLSENVVTFTTAGTASMRVQVGAYREDVDITVDP